MVEEIDQHDRPEQQRRPAPCRAPGSRTGRPGCRPRSARRSGAKPASTVVRPSTADSTEIAGVIMRIAVEERGGEHAEQDDARGPALAGRSRLRLISASSARLPPSPLLSARMMIVTYLIVTTIIIDQKIRLSTPRICESVGRQRVMAGEGLAEGVDRAGADVAEDDADRADRELGEAAIGDGARPGASAGVLGRRRYRSSVRNGKRPHFLRSVPRRRRGGAAA